LLSDFLKRCFQDFKDPSCDFSQTTQTPIVNLEDTKLTTQKTTTIQSLARKVEEFNLLFRTASDTTNVQHATTTRTTTTTIDTNSQSIKTKVYNELRAAFFRQN